MRLLFILLVSLLPSALARTDDPFPHSAPVEVKAPVTLIAHMGNSTYYPENTIIAFNAGFNDQSDSVEIDLRTSKDGEIVIIHDSTVDRTTNGTGAVHLLTLAQLKALDAGSRKSSTFAGTRIPTLTETLQWALGKGKIMLDVKKAAVDKVKAVVVATGFPERDLSICAWTPNEVAQYHAAMPEAEIIFVPYTQPASWSDSDFVYMRGLGASAYAIEWISITKEFVDAAHRNGLKMYSSTANSVNGAQKIVEKGVDGILSDNPKILRPGTDLDTTLQIRAYEVTRNREVTLNWRSRVGRTYEVETSQDSTNWFPILGSQQTATGIISAFTFTRSGDHGFYRVIERPLCAACW